MCSKYLKVYSKSIAYCLMTAREMELVLSRSPAYFYADLSVALPLLPQLRRISITRCDGGITTELLRIVFSAPALKDLQIDHCYLEDLDPYLDGIVPMHLPIRRLVYAPKWRFNGATRAEQLELEATLLMTLLEQFHTTLEVLQIPSETAQISFMTSLSWPSLRSLTLLVSVPCLGHLS